MGYRQSGTSSVPPPATHRLPGRGGSSARPTGAVSVSRTALGPGTPAYATHRRSLYTAAAASLQRNLTVGEREGRRGGGE